MQTENANYKLREPNATKAKIDKTARRPRTSRASGALSPGSNGPQLTRGSGAALASPEYFMVTTAAATPWLSHPHRLPWRWRWTLSNVHLQTEWKIQVDRGTERHERWDTYIGIYPKGDMQTRKERKRMRGRKGGTERKKKDNDGEREREGEWERRSLTGHKEKIS